MAYIDEAKQDKVPLKCEGACKGTGTIYLRKENLMVDCPECKGRGTRDRKL